MGQEGQLELSEGLTDNRSLTTLDFSNEVPIAAEDITYFFNLTFT